MVGDDGVNVAGVQPVPQQLAVVRLPDRWAALELRLAVLHVLCGEQQVVRAGLHGDPHTVSARGANHRQGIGRGQVQYVRPRPSPPGRLDDLGDGDVLRAARARGQVVAVPLAVRGWRAVDRVRVLRVDDQQ
jgi:hypothetical protein